MHAFLALLVATAHVNGSALLQAALNPNPGLKSYVANAELVAQTHPLPIRRAFRGTAYYVAPTRTIRFDNVTGVLSRFKTLTTTLPSFSQVQQSYGVGVPVDDGAVSAFTLVPRRAGGRVTSVVVSIDDTTALVDRAVYHYTDGSVLSFTEHYQTLDGFRVAATVDVSAHFPGYSVDGTIRFTGYRTNVPVPAAMVDGT